MIDYFSSRQTIAAPSVNPAPHPDGCDADSSPMGTESPGTSQMSPPPSYNEIPGTVRPLNRDVPPPSYEDAVDPNGTYDKW